MVTVPCLQKQDAFKNTNGYRTEKFSSFLSQMQTGNPDQRTITEYINHQRARRYDAEPVTVSEISYGYRLFVLPVRHIVWLFTGLTSIFTQNDSIGAHILPKNKKLKNSHFKNDRGK